MDEDRMIAALSARLFAEECVGALFLAGSRGAGRQDRFSDVDLVAIVEPEDQARVAGLWRSAVEALAPVVFWNERSGGGLLLNAITDRWLRIDLFLTGTSRFGARAKDQVRPLFDRAGIFATLPDSLPPMQPDKARVFRNIQDFLRVLGLLVVGLGRGEYVLLVKGAGLLRDLLTDLMLEDCPLPDRGGALHLSRLLRPDQMAVLAALPYPQPHRESVIAAHLALAEAFLPLAREMAGRLAIDWPEPFEAATRDWLRTEAGLRFR